MLYLNYCLQKNRGCGLQISSYFDTFTCLTVVTWLLVVRFDNPFVNILRFK